MFLNLPPSSRPAAAENVKVFAGFDAGNDMVWNSEISEPFQIGMDYQVTVTLYLRVPLDEHTRLLARILVDDVLVDKSSSDWFDT
jgi:hypothetical protein